MKEILSIFLACQVLLSSMSFNIGMHFCGESLKSLSLFHEATPCKHAVADEAEHPADCPFHSDEKDKNCCNDKQLKIEGQDIESPISTFSFDLSPQYEFIAAYALSLVRFYSEDVRNARFHNYKPPLIQTDISVLIQTFLI